MSIVFSGCLARWHVMISATLENYMRNSLGYFTLQPCLWLRRVKTENLFKLLPCWLAWVCFHRTFHFLCVYVVRQTNYVCIDVDPSRSFIFFSWKQKTSLSSASWKKSQLISKGCCVFFLHSFFYFYWRYNELNKNRNGIFLQQQIWARVK